MPPTVVFITPFIQQHFFYGQTINISVTVKDDVNIESVHFEIIDDENRHVLTSRLFSEFSTNDEVVSGYIEFDDIHLTSGAYYVRVVASDGENLKTVFREIHLNEAPLELKKVFLVHKPSLGTTQIDSLTEIGNWQQAISLDIDFDLGDANSYFQHLLFAGTDLDGITVLDAADFSTIMHDTYPYGISSDYFTAIAWDDDSHRHYVSAKDGTIRAVSNYGNVNDVVNITDGYHAEKILVTENYIFTYERDITNSNGRIAVYYKSSAQFFQSAIIESEVTAMVVNGDENEILVIANNATESDFKWYHPDGNTVTDLDFLFQIENTKAHKACMRNDSQYYIAHETSILLYQDSQPVSSGNLSFDVIEMKYDPLGDVLYVLDQSGLHLLNNTATEEIAFIDTPANSSGFFLLYNK